MQNSDRLTAIHALIQSIFPTAHQRTFERVQEGVSTEVYRIWCDDSVFYLRVLPELGASFAPEVLVHRLLWERHLHVPQVIYFEHCQPELQRSVMVTTEIKGGAIGYATHPRAVKQVLVEAGKALAIINQVPVQGFGWIQRDAATLLQLRAEVPTYRDFIRLHVDEPFLHLCHRKVLQPEEVQAVQEILRQYDPLFETNQAYLAHGDFDVTHIYHQEGSYTGIIDFGEIRGADSFYDLGHFNVECSLGLPYLLEGYRAAAELPDNYEFRIHLASLLIALRRLGRYVQRYPTAVDHHPDLLSIRRDIHWFHVHCTMS